MRKAARRSTHSVQAETRSAPDRAVGAPSGPPPLPHPQRDQVRRQLPEGVAARFADFQREITDDMRRRLREDIAALEHTFGGADYLPPREVSKPAESTGFETWAAAIWEDALHRLGEDRAAIVLAMTYCRHAADLLDTHADLTVNDLTYLQGLVAEAQRCELQVQRSTRADHLPSKLRRKKKKGRPRATGWPFLDAVEAALEHGQKSLKAALFEAAERLELTASYDALLRRYYRQRDARDKVAEQRQRPGSARRTGSSS